MKIVYLKEDYTQDKKKMQSKLLTLQTYLYDRKAFYDSALFAVRNIEDAELKNQLRDIIYDCQTDNVSTEDCFEQLKNILDKDIELTEDISLDDRYDEAFGEPQADVFGPGELSAFINDVINFE